MTTQPNTPADLAAWARRALTSTRTAPSPPPATTGWPGLYLGTGRTGPVWGGPQHHALIIGPPRSGKTTCLAAPNLTVHPGPVVATSTKTDLAETTWTRRAGRGVCWLWDPTGTITPPEGVRPLRWSPVSGCGSWDHTLARAHALATAARPGPASPAGHESEAHWIERAQALLAPLLHAAAIAPAQGAPDQQSPAPAGSAGARSGLEQVLSWLHRRDLVGPLGILESHGALLPADLLTGIAATEDREASGIFSTADGLLAAYRTDTALASARDPNFDPAAFARSVDTVYLCAPGTSQAQHAPLIVCLLYQIRSAVYAARPHPPMLWALDELANIAPLPDLPATISEGASQGLVVLACLQDLSQARTRWGAAADGFATLFTHKLVLPGVADLVTLRQISALAGEMDVPVTSATRTPQGRWSTSTSPQRRPRLPLDSIARGIPGQALWINRTHLATVGLPLRG
jgi:type IV secretion system protein VirD4